MKNIFKNEANRFLLVYFPLISGGILAVIMHKEYYWFIIVLIGIFFLFLFFLNPELPLAIQINGTILYFYLVYKLGFQTDRFITAGFYGYLVFSYILGGIILLSKDSKNLKLGSLDMLFLLLYVIYFLSYFIFSTDNDNAYIKVTYAPFLVVAPYIGIQFLLSEKRLKRFFKYCVIIPALLMIPSFFELLFNPIFENYNRFSMYKFVGRPDNPILFGITFAVFLLILIVWMFERKKYPITFFPLIFAAAYLLVRSGSRGATLSFILTTIFYFFFVSKNLSRKGKILLVTLGFLMISTVFSFLPEATIDFYRYTFSPEARLQQVSSIYQRLILWADAIGDIWLEPILGVGTGNSVGGIGYPHNILLEVWAELGLVGIVVFFALLYFAFTKGFRFIKSKKTRKLDMLMKISLLLLFYSLCEAMVSSYMGSDTLLYSAIGLISAIDKLDRDPDITLIRYS